MLDLVSIVSAVGGSGLLIVGRDVWLARRTVKASEAAEQRNQVREPLIVESILLGNTTKVAEIFQAALTELEEGKKRLAEELRETRGALNEKIDKLTQDLNRERELNREKDKTIVELYARLGQVQLEIDKLKGR